jgi:Lon protease-like protein
MSEASAANQGEPDVVPMFPLGQVLMPGRPLPLRIFEPRYRAMVADMTAPAPHGTPKAQHFGVVLLQQGLEVITNWALRPDPEAVGAMAAIGTLAEVLELKAKRDGGFELLAVGSRRFRVKSWVSGKPYAQAEVEYLDEQDGVIPEGLAEEVVTLYSEHIGVLTARTGQSPLALAELPAVHDPNLLSYYVASTLPLDHRDRQSLLADPDAGQRLAHVRDLLRAELVLLKRTRTVAVPPEALRLPFRPN